jgi:hypothetical protein
MWGPRFEGYCKKCTTEKAPRQTLFVPIYCDNPYQTLTGICAIILAEVFMPKTLKQILFWTPRILGILFVAFLSLFALDVFGEGYGFWKTALALLIHLIPSLVLVAALVLAWRWEWVGAALFAGFGILYLVDARGVSPVLYYMIFAGIPFLVGILFLLGWIWRKQNRIR